MLYSHNAPQQMLYQHLLGTSQWGEVLSKSAKCSLLSDIPEKILHEFFLLHDIGKCTRYFQDYLLHQNYQGELKNHSFFSAVFFLAYEINREQAAHDQRYLISMFYAIIRHHGNLEDIKHAYQTRIQDSQRETLLEQWEGIDKEELLQLMEKCALDAAGGFLEIPFEIHLNRVEEYLKLQRKESKKLLRKGDYTYYFQTQILYSLLIDADKSQAGLRDLSLADRKDYNASVPEYLGKRTSKESQLNVLRNEAQQEVVKKVLTASKLIMTLTLPTGMGKTLTSFYAAFVLKERLKKETGKSYRIIYVMPYMSIIDQNAEIFETLLKEQNPDISQNIFLKHHHLAELSWKSSENEYLNTQNAKLLIEGWNSEIIVTTFHQFFLTLIGYTNGMQRKFNKLANSIVLIDEIQAIPVKYYKLIGQMLEWYTEKMDSRVIAMTATQPYIFNQDTSQELCDSPKYYKALSRTKIINQIHKKMTVEEFVQSFQYSESKTYLFIVNTIQCGKDMQKLLKEQYPDLSITFLSTLLTPYRKKIRIKEIKEGKYDMVVSTQLVEAGVDINFDVVYRDFAPLPSIFQSAGRGNREWDPNKVGSVYIINLVSGKRRYCDMVYTESAVDLNVTEKVLLKPEYEESEFMDVIQQYFKYISKEEIKSQDESYDLIEGICRQFYFSSTCENPVGMAPVSSFELIKNTWEQYSVFIEENDDAAKLWDQYCTLSRSAKDDWEAKTEILNITRKMADYVVTVSKYTFCNKGNNKPPMVDLNGIYYYAAQGELDKYYDLDTGYGIGSCNYFF